MTLPCPFVPPARMPIAPEIDPLLFTVTALAAVMASAPLASAVIMEVVARRMSSTTHAVRPRFLWDNAENSTGEKSTSMLLVMQQIQNLFLQLRVNPRVVKQVLLRVAPERAKVRRRELLQSLQRPAPAGKVEPPQRFRHPDIHRKCVLKATGKKQNAIGDFAAHARQAH